ncbi:MAG: DUF58 domain-containing protein [Desulfurococcales archaeon]|nr:DUF58 domain-containing protein [Desulfurococcales archaeon]
MEESQPTGVMVTWRFYSILLAASALTAAYVYVKGEDPGLLAAASALLGVALGSYLYAKASWNSVMALSARRILPPGVVEGRVFNVNVVLENNSLIPLLALEVADSPPALFRVETPPSTLAVLPPRARLALEYRLVPVAGRHSFGPLTLIVRDPLGLVVGRAVLDSVEQSEVRVLPKAAYSLALKMAASAVPYMGVSSRKRGWGTTFYYLREYSEGDELRSIDWRALARLGKFYVKVFEAEEALKVLLVVIVDRGMLYGPYGSTMFEDSLRVAATFSIYHLARGDSVDIHVYSGDGRRYSQSNLRGRGSIPWALRILASVAPPTPEGPTLEDARRFLFRELPARLEAGGYYAVLVTGLEDAPSMLASRDAAFLLRRTIGGLLVHLYKPAYSSAPTSSVLERVARAKEVLESTWRFRSMLKPLNYEYIAVGPSTRIEAVLRGVILHGGRRS